MADHALATVSNPSSALTDFTLIVDLSDMPASWWSAVDTSDGTRGRVYKGDGTTRLACDWIDFDDTAETGLLRVLWSGTLATSGTQELWIEPPVSGNASVSASDTYGSDNAYASTFEAYYPLQSDGTDRTANGYDLTAYGAPTYVSGPVGNMASLNGTDQYFEGSVDPIADRPMSILAAFRHTNETQSGEEAIVCPSNAVDSTTYQSIQMNSEDVELHDRHVGARVSSSGVDYADGNDHTVCGTTVSDAGAGETRATIYLDGAYVSVDTVTPATSNLPIQNVGIGSRRDVSPGQYWNGGISHVEFHSVEVSTAYISMFDDMMDQSTFWGTWTWETSGGGGGATVIEGLHRIAMGERQGASQGLGGVLQE